MAHMHNIWFNKTNKAYQLSKFPETEDTHVSGANNVDKNWVLIASFEADTLDKVVDGFSNISKAHREIV